MRLICPNCDAQYEVDDSVIPEGGRDVQCSNCGYTWFQAAAGDAPQADAAGEHPPHTPPEQHAPEAGPASDVVPDADAPAPRDAAPDTAAEPAAEPAPQHDHADSETSEPTPGHAQRQALDDSVLEVLREEATRETEARRTEAGNGSARQNPPRPAPAGAASGLSARMARLRGVPQNAADNTGHGTTPARRDLLPNIEEINSTLRATSERRSGKPSEPSQAADEAPIPGKRSGFSRGFAIIIIVGVLAASVYMLAPTIAKKVPASTPYLVSYVTTVNDLRAWLNGSITALLEKATVFLNGLTN